MGLVGFDLLTALTVGRGGTFEDVGDRKRYRPSGNEPLIHLYSRSGVPYCAKSAHGVDPYGEYQPVVCTPEAIAGLTHPGGASARRQVDFRRDLLPLLFAEMQSRYLIHAAFLKGGADESADVRDRLTRAWVVGAFDGVVDGYEPVYGRFDPASHLFAGSGRSYTSGADYQSQVYDMVEADLEEALAVGGSPVKAALEVTADPSRPAALGDRVRWAHPRVVPRFPDQCPGSDQPHGGRTTAAPFPAAPGSARCRRGADVARAGSGGGRRSGRAHGAPLHPARRGDHRHGQRCGPRPSRSSVAGPVQLAPPQPLVRQWPV